MFGAIEVVNKKAVIDLNKCTLCGACVESCKFDAIVVGAVSDRPLQTKDIIAMPSKALVLEKPKGPDLTRRQALLLEHIRKSGKITRKEYSDLFNISVPTAARDLRYLMDKGFLKAEGPLGPGRWYELK